jgi:AraC-like DNA-binding protein
MQVWGRDIISTFIYFAAGLSFLMAIQKLVPTKRRVENYLIFILYLALAFILFSLSNVLTDRERELPVCIFLLLTSFSLIGPLTVLYTHALIYPETPKDKYLKYHFVFPLIIFGGEFIFFFTQSLKTQQDAIAAFLSNRLGHPFAIPIILTTVSSTAYFFFRYRVLFQVFEVREIRKQIIFIFILASTSAIALYSVVFGFLFSIDLIFAVGAVMIGGLIITLFFAAARYPDFFGPLSREVLRRKYEKSLLNGLDLGLLQNRLTEFMRVKKLYHNPVLGLKTLAKELGIHPNQLSEFLSQKLHTNFAGYVNQFRIEEVCQLLKENPDQDILTTCFFVGFNSKSTFNDLFKKMVGVTPSEYRDSLKK